MTSSSWALRCACAAVFALPTWVLADGNDPVFITGSLADRAVSEVPYSVTVIDRATLRDSGPMVNLSEAMAGVPGFVVSNRSNYAQDLQINSRGFGARANFGVRGVRLYEDGIPATGPDGQGQVAQFDLAGADRIEVLRGPFSVLYGNSSGGVISLERAPVRQSRAEGEIDAGSFGFRQLRAGLAEKFGGGLDLSLAASTMGIDGFRPHSAADRRMASLRLGWQGEHDSLTTLLSYYTQPAQDPLGLTRALFNANPLQTASQASQFNTRKASDQTQIGSTWKHRFDEGALREARVTVYFGERSVSQFQAIPSSTEIAASSPGGLVAFDRAFDGVQASLRWAWDTVDLQAGIAADDQRDARKGYLNYTGTSAAPTYGVQGTLRRDETDSARSRDAFAQGEWAVLPTLTASMGVRSGHVTLASRDYYLSNGDDSGSSRFSYTNPVAGLRWQPTRALQLYVSGARGIETPTLNDVAYLPSGGAGINSALRPQISDQIEAGAKWHGAGVSADFTVFQAKVANEIVIASSTGGRTTYENAPHTMRNGFELGSTWQLAPEWRGRLALSLLNARYQQSYLSCPVSGCTLAIGGHAATTGALAPVMVNAGNQIAGTQRGSLYAELARASADWGETAVELHSAGRTAPNDVNSDFAGGYATASLRWKRTLALAGAGQQLEVLARIDNVFNRTYAGSVIVNDANSRFFETGVPRNFMLALRLIGDL